MSALYHDLHDYIEAKDRWTNTPAVILPTGETLMIVKGKRISKAEFNAANPKPNYEPLSGEQLDGERKGTLYGVRNVNK
jgi:hypothetical protein